MDICLSRSDLPHSSGVLPIQHLTRDNSSAFCRSPAVLQLCTLGCGGKIGLFELIVQIGLLEDQATTA